MYVWTLTQPNSTSSNVTPHFSTRNNLPGGTTTSQSFRDLVPIAARLGPPVKPNPPTIDRATHMPSGKEISALTPANVLKVKTALYLCPQQLALQLPE